MQFRMEEWEDLSEEQVVEKLASIDGLLSLDRNDPCWCGSGDKYKKCHDSFDRRLVFEASVYENIQFEDQPLPSCYELGLEGDDLTRFEEIQGRIDAQEAISEADLSFLTDLSKRKPDTLFIYHLLVMAAQILEKKEEADAALAKAHALLPDDLFTLLLDAKIAQMRGASFLERVRNAQTLPQLYPDRTVFSPFEVLSFHESLAEYFATVGDLRGVECHVQFLTLLFSEHKDLLESSNQLVKDARAERNAQIIGSKFEALSVVD